MSGEEPMKKCVDCGQTGHTSTACNNGKAGILELFGVRIDPTADQSEDDGYEPKSMEVLKMHNNEHGSSIDLEYMSDEHSHDTKKGMPWTEDEHRSFLMGLEKLGRGRWRAISKQYVPSRTPTQVASHAQKFFIRLNSTEDKRKRRSSLFDMPLDEYVIYYF
ncbi:putative transcription factor MYB-HB-like family [Helianthus annuus]|uniref:Transcription factor MYB-related family n=1 Tax=Helianthus annuus TaxID=4232 RepID=A0A9K3NMC2_HELAN|nr:putative transcription factor MYB-related family [Helianthus annuus]KAJ0570004.1 putative transcription factor MYB-HB-like family [Helianthus annuus]KAJ0576704.1 putative transcription factor MYB-HB-like family [Helianthus annuus]KAJ0584333.1 putative transcription factor MYB-HB-like family [Helianthus annuus]KAJ0746964.1 putative transcription factor MYB-HB-like family [Helianthus annuus]